jgi:nucleotide-binding universal stress UspA family protein
MKTILVPLDLTASSEHVLTYANKLAVRWPAEVVLLYCHHGPITAAEAQTLKQRLHTLAERLRYQQLTRQDGRRIRYQYRVLSGCLHDHARAEVARCAADLLVMGLEHIDCGQADASGSHAAVLIDLVTCPVLVVPPGRRPLPSSVVFSADFDRLDTNALPRLSALAGAFPAPLQLVQFYSPSQRPDRMRLKRALEKARPQLTWPTITTHLLEDDDQLEGTSEFCARTQAQLLIVAPTSSALLRRLFDACYTTTRAYHTQIPVLVMRQAVPQPSIMCCERCAQHAQHETQRTELAHTPTT